MYVKKEKMPGFEVLGMKYRGKNEKKEVPELWEAFVPRMGEIKNRVDPKISYGVMDGFDRETGEFDYIACVEVTPSDEGPSGMEGVKIPDQTYAVFKSTLPTIRQAFDYAYREWFPQSGYERSPGPEFELYGDEFHKDQTIYIYIPLSGD